MKKVILAFLAGTALFLGCSSWPTNFERIDHDNSRVLDFVYKNCIDSTICEAMPGDSVRLYAYFSGEEITDIEWKISFNVFENIYGEDTALDIKQFEHTTIDPDMSGFSEATYGFGFQFKIPDDIMYTSKSIKDELISATGLNKYVLLGFMDTLTAIDTSLWSTIPEFQQYLPMIQKDAPLLMQVLTAPIRIFARVNGLYDIESDFIVRYNRSFQHFENVNVNHNPKINFVGLYKLKDASAVEFDTDNMTDNDTTICLFLADSADTASMGKNIIYTDTILIDLGYRYYVTVDSGLFNGVNQKDNGVSVDMSGSITSGIETFFTQWFFQHDKSEITNVDVDDLMILNTSGNFLDRIFPPLDGWVKKTTLWVQVYDYFLGERFRPYGSSLREVNINFKYSNAYLDSLNAR
jgi:hypothetical protein